MRPVVLGDFQIDAQLARHFEAFEHAFLVRLDEARVPRHIGCENSSEPTFCASDPIGLHCASPLCTILHQPTRARIEQRR